MVEAESQQITRSMTSSRASRSSTPWRVVTRLMTLRPTSGATCSMASVMILCRIALLLAASLPPCSRVEIFIHYNITLTVRIRDFEAASAVNILAALIRHACSKCMVERTCLFHTARNLVGTLFYCLELTP